MSEWTRAHGSLPPDWTPSHIKLDLHCYQLVCDEPGCIERSPLSDAVYFAGGARMARAIAEQNGWMRVRLDGEIRDLCPFHVPRGSKP